MPQGAHWIKADLHVHTPASHDFKLRSVSPHDYIAAMQARNLELVAIADHSTGAWVDRMKSAARDLKKNGRIGVLPGVELSIGGVHLVLIFPEEFHGDHIDHILSKLDIVPDMRGRHDTVCTTKTVLEVIHIVHEQNGMVVGAHCMSEKTGILRGLSGQARSQALEVIDAVEAKPSNDVTRLRSRLGELTNRNIPIIVSSDAHHPDELHPDVTFLKVGLPTFRGFSQIRYEPFSRVSLTAPPSPTHPLIIGFEVSQGLFQDVPVRFNPHLNTLIGGRGTGKSAVLDLIRFGLGIGARMEVNESTFRRRIKNFVGTGGTVSVFFQDGQGGLFRSDRRGDFTETSKGGSAQIAFTFEPKVSRLIDGRFIVVNETPSSIMPIEFFGQGEVMELSKIAQDQLALIDEHIDFGGLKAQERAAVSDLQSAVSVVIEAEERLEQLTHLVGKKDELSRRVAELNHELSNPVFVERDLWDKERSFMGWAKDRLDALSRMQAQPVPIISSGPTLEKNTPNKLIANDVKKVLSELAGTMERLFKELTEAAQTANSLYQEHHAKWVELDTQHFAMFQAALRQAGGLQLQTLHNEKAIKEEELRHIVEEYEPKLEQQRRRVNEFLAGRKKTVERLIALRESIHAARQEQLNSLHERLGSVQITVEAKKERRQYFEYLKVLYNGSRIQSLETQLELVVRRLEPHQLAEILLSRDQDRLVALTGVTTLTASKMIAYPGEHGKLALQSIEVTDRPTISLKRAGEVAYTPLEDLSDGERCSAILSIALLEKTRPLLIDQPEDELDNQYVIEDIVANIGSIKHVRQLIIATHDPNIPVLGDAELVIRVTKEPGVTHCNILAQGALEQPDVLEAVLGLEGGQAAFEQRRRKYMLA